MLINPAELRTVRSIDADGNVVAVRFEYRIIQVDTATGQPSDQFSEWTRVDSIVYDERMPEGVTVEDLISDLPPVNVEE